LITKGFLEEFGPQRIIDTPLASSLTRRGREA
jgi:pyruvate/2-oxoglutarate/acetoin dehydrogenase E1 component